ncbi:MULTISPECIES: formyltransferase family protein [Bradyrhizobium]|uniref:Formyltransferase family protein n=1 Tax=Bradyrhizobium brasilense TaxID=1419277 RepID=A0ABY8JN93_9BRAD|nr:MULTISPECIES: formyltransferase family protein [Bradyrhizobium]WFU66921.1 formyltransferase family protein [Bradyrhizobium brasilense]
MTQKIILLTSSTGPALDSALQTFGPSASIAVVRDLETLLAVPVDQDTSLISFGTGVIVPAGFLASLAKPAYNLHAASPEFPGRDPHHFAIYRAAQTYGATLHLMTARVDDGAIVAVEMFDVRPDATPDSLLAEANRAAVRLLERCAERMLDREPMPELPDVGWGPIKTRRSDFLRLCRVNALITTQEFELRRRACASTAHTNLTAELHGQIFRIDQAAPVDERLDEFSEFTEAGFLKILRQLKSADYRFVRYGAPPSGPHVIWRHDVDISMNRAVRLAEIENQEGVVATYFINPRSCFYSIFEPETEVMLRRIQSLGHEIGLHFDASAYVTKTWTADALNAAVRREQALLETLLQSPIRALSWHNPDQSNLLDFQDDEIAGLSNAYSGALRRDYVYCSDSNGYWRFKPMGEVIAAGHERLHLLTHPDWWTPDAMSPSDRITRALLGRARRLRDDYDRRLALAGRRNVGGK